VSPIIVTKLSWQAVFYIFGASATLWLPFWFATSIPKQRLEDIDDKSCTEGDSQVDTSEDVAVTSRLVVVDARSTDTEQLLDRPQDAASEIVAAAPQASEFWASIGLDAGFIALTQRKEVWAICAAQYCQSWGAYALLNWLPTYFSEQVLI
jgi:MFS transporter, ACS family, solute carrier family 17 (sodium-dependent inorganic phosphate cotransporter), other